MGNWKFYDTFRKKGGGKFNKKEFGKFASKWIGSIATLTFMAYKFMADTDEDKDNFLYTLANKSPDELSRYIYFPLPGGGTFRIKIPEMMGSLTGLTYMGMIDAFMETDYNLEEYMDAGTNWIPPALNVYQFKNFTMNIPPLVLKYPMQVAWNKKNYPEVMPITPEWQMKELTEDRYSAYTSKTSRKLIAWMQANTGLEIVDPNQLDHLIKGSLGYPGQFGLGVSDIFLDSDFQSLERKINPLRAFYEPDNRRLMGGRNARNYYASEYAIKRNERNVVKNPDAGLSDIFNIELQKTIYKEFNEFLKVVRPIYSDNPDALTPKMQNRYTELAYDVTDFAHSNPDSVMANINEATKLMKEMKNIAGEAGAVYTIKTDEQIKRDVQNITKKGYEALAIRRLIEQDDDVTNVKEAKAKLKEQQRKVKVYKEILGF